MTDFLKNYRDSIDFHEIEALRIQVNEKWSKQKLDYQQKIDLCTTFKSDNLTFGDTVQIGTKEEWCQKLQDIGKDPGLEYAKFIDVLKAFIPWKKGPFSLMGTQVESEWDSSLKWQRMQPYLGNLDGLKIADIGCHNGYFMYRMNEIFKPALVLGFEPVLKHKLLFEFLQKFACQDNLQFEGLGVEDVHHFPSFFDRIFCMGILYHHKDPVGLLQKMRNALAPKGQVIIDCQGIPGDDPMVLVPRKKYAAMRGVWWLPTKSALENWIYRAGFQKINWVFSHDLLPNEQKTTEWAPINSLEDFLDPNDPSKTIEGYPAPKRFYCIACP